MKPKYIIAITTFALAGLASCTSVLDKDDLTAVSEKATWDSEILAKAFLDKCYKDNMPVFSSDCAKYSDEGNGGGDFIHGRLTAVATAGGPLGGPSDAPYKGEYWMYDKIYTLNVLLKSIDGGSLPETTRNQIKAQALFLRAYQYFQMVKIYGGVPLILTPQNRHDDLYVTRNTAKECVEQIVQDLDDAAKALPSIWGAEDFGRITKGAAMAFKGRVLLTYASKQFNPNGERSRWETAYNACLAAKNELAGEGQRALHPVYSEIWTQETTSETVITTRFLDPVRTHNFMAGLRPLEFSVGAVGNNQPTLDMALAFPMADGTAPGIDVNNDGVKEPFDATATDATGMFWLNRDPRFYDIIVYNGAPYPLNGMPEWFQGCMYTYKGGEDTHSPTGTGFYSCKFSIPEKTATEAKDHGDMDWIEMRYAEVLLNLAECAAEVGNKSDEVYAILKDIRKRAGITPNADGLYGLKANMNQQELIEAVLYERRIELAFEGKRFWDLLRRKIFSDMKGYSRYRIEIQVKGEYASMARRDFIMMIKNDAELMTKNYFKYFTTQKWRIDETYQWDVKDNYYFQGLARRHFEQNPKLQQTIGWESGDFDPLK